MNKILIILLLVITLHRSQSHAIYAISGLKNSDNGNSKRFQSSEEFDGPLEFYTKPNGDNNNEKYTRILINKRTGNDVLTRRSILDKNFMRFGRNAGRSGGPSEMEQESNMKDFSRFNRGMKDSFIRFGRGTQDSFIRFGKSIKKLEMYPFDESNSNLNDDNNNYLRSGKSARESFIRFGKRDSNFMRFGRGKLKKKLLKCNKKFGKYHRDCYYLSFETGIGKSDRFPDPFERFGEFRPPDNNNNNNLLIMSSPFFPDYESNEKNESISKLKNDDQFSPVDDDDVKEYYHDDDDNNNNIMRMKRKTLNGGNNNNINNTNKKNHDDRIVVDEKLDGKMKKKREDDDDWKIPEDDVIISPNYYFKKYPEYFPKKFSRIHNLKYLTDFGNVKFHNKLTPPFFPVSTNF
ncbi:conserved hypothetical protein [Pediculus humanus corporis]|uniref:Uncharacterized protein n=1 Tax=Pediculus humanus subsp. corporis TaxID=121224 RepID=E0VB87_PEDHC|nr:uncharacterized protein Phum_PHUM055090 [Pediculus humanus corporis]EEB10643.1 conserved hypothetical protein [Pediculus humanus corporis]